MRALRNFKSNRCYHLISRIANRAFFLTEEERSRFVARMWRVAEFSGIGVRMGDEPGKQSFRERFFRRMYDVSAFMKTLKQNSTMSYNSHIVPWEQIREMHEKSIHLVLRELEDEIPLWGHSLQGFLLCCINRQKSRCCWRFSCFENFPHKILISRLRFRFAGSVPA